MRTTNPTPPVLVPQAEFDDIMVLISAACHRAVQAVHASLFEPYWQVGQTTAKLLQAKLHELYALNVADDTAEGVSQ